MNKRIPGWSPTPRRLIVAKKVDDDPRFQYQHVGGNNEDGLNEEVVV